MRRSEGNPPSSSRGAVLKQLIQDCIETRRTVVQLDGLGLLAGALFEQLIGNVEGGEDCHFGERGHRELLGDLAHLAVHERSYFEDVSLVGIAANGVTVPEDRDLDRSLGVHGALASPLFPAIGLQNLRRRTGSRGAAGNPTARRGSALYQ